MQIQISVQYLQYHCPNVWLQHCDKKNAAIEKLQNPTASQSITNQDKRGPEKRWLIVLNEADLSLLEGF